MRLIKYLAALTFISLIILVSLPLSNQFLQNRIVNSPDANSNLKFIEEYAQSGNLYILEEYAPLDKYNLFHFRSGLSYNNKIVPMSFLGVPVNYGFFFSIFGDYIVYINVIFSLLLMAFLFLIYKLHFRNKTSFFITGLLLATPVIYYFSHSFLNILPAITFLVGGLYYLLIYKRTQSNLFLFLSGLFFAISMTYRYEFLILVSFCFLIFLVDEIKSKRKLMDLFWVSLMFSFIIFVFFSHIFISNLTIYGSPIKTGTQVFNKAYFPERATGSFINYIIPSNFNVAFLIFNIYKYLVVFSPLFFLVFFLGIFSFHKTYKKSILTISLLIVLFFIIAYQGTSNVWGSSITWGSASELNPELDHSLIRYWIVIFIFAPFYLAFVMSKININKRFIIPLMISVIIISSLPVLTSLQNTSAFSLASKNYQKYDSFASFFEGASKETLVFCSLDDKYIDKFATPFTWWNGREKYNPNQIVNSVNILWKNGYQDIIVYRQDEVEMVEIENLLNSKGYALDWKYDTRVYRVIKNDPKN